MADLIPRGLHVGIDKLTSGWLAQAPSFPNLRGLSIKVTRTHSYGSHVSTAVSGKEQRSSRQGVPKYKYDLQIEVLNDADHDVEAFAYFVTSVAGRYGVFLFEDPYDHQVRVCRLDEDAASIGRIVAGLWKVDQLSIVSVKTGARGPAGTGTGMFPALRGTKIDVERTPFFSNTVAVDPESGREQRTNWYATPRWRYKLGIEFLDEARGETTTFAQFVDDHHGSLRSFLYSDPWDGTARLCRFADDSVPATQFVNGVWEVSNLDLISVS